MRQRTIKIVAISLMAAILGNLAWLNIRVLTQPKPTTWPVPLEKEVRVIEKTIEKEAPETPNPPIGGSSPPQTQAQPAVSPIKEVFITLGSGSTSAQVYSDLKGAEATINTQNYPNIKEAYFEAALSVTGGNGEALAQLFNVSDKHPVWFSEIRSVSSQAQRVVSQKIILDAGEKIYRVQAKSTIAALAFVDNARIKIVLD